MIADSDSSIRCCPRCKEPIINSRKKYCNNSCKFWFNQIRKDNEKHLPPVKKRTEKYFHIVIGSTRAKSNARQGKRVGGMIVGSMSAMVYVTVEEVVELTQENLKKHFAGISGYTPETIVLGTGERVKKQDIFNRFGITLN